MTSRERLRQLYFHEQVDRPAATGGGGPRGQELPALPSPAARTPDPAPADVVLLGDDYSDKIGPMMSPAMFEDIILPHDTAVVASIKQAGTYCIKHSDGNIRKIMDQLVGTGLDALGPLEDVPGMELDRIFARYPGRIAVMGNLSVDLLSRGTVEEVVAATKKLLREVSAKGPHILSSGNTISFSVKPENYLAMVRTARECGRYPIR